VISKLSQKVAREGFRWAVISSPPVKGPDRGLVIPPQSYEHIKRWVVSVYSVLMVVRIGS
jgi:hypothetical protein